MQLCLSFLIVFLFFGPASAAKEKPRLGDIPDPKVQKKKATPPVSEEASPTPEERKALIDQACAELLQEATVAQKAGRHLEAKVLLERILVLDSRHVEAGRRLRSVRQQLDKQSKQKTTHSPQQSLREKLEKDLNRNYQEGRWDEARTAAEKLLAVDPGNARIRQRLDHIETQLFDEAVARGKKREKSGDLDGAVDAYRLALGIREDPGVLALVDQLEARTEAMKRRRSESLYLEALAAVQSGRKSDAARLCRQALRLDPGNIYAEKMLFRLNDRMP